VHVEQDERRAQVLGGRECRRPVSRFRDRVPGLIEHGPRDRAEARMIVDEENGGGHVSVVGDRAPLPLTANRTP
jgi:hypothetical protein